MMKKRIAALAMVLVMTLVILPMSAAAIGDEPFTDVGEKDWFCEAVEYCRTEGLIQGTGDGEFKPYSAATRGMIVTVLHRDIGEPHSGMENAFSDVPSGRYYSEAVNWASDYDIVSGNGDGEFRPGDAITRQELIMILYRYAKNQGQDMSGDHAFSGYSDAGSISRYAVGAMLWAVDKELIRSEWGRLEPTGLVTRAEAAVILERFMKL